MLHSAGGATDCSPARERWVTFTSRSQAPEGAKDRCVLRPCGAVFGFTRKTQRSRAGLHSVAPPALSKATRLPKKTNFRSVVIQRHFVFAQKVVPEDARNFSADHS